MTKPTSPTVPYTQGFEAGREAYWAGKPDNTNPWDESDWTRGYKAGRESAASQVRTTLGVK